MQSAEKTSLSKSNSLNNESTAAPPKPSSPKPTGVRPKVGTPPRRSMAPQALATSMSRDTEPSLLGKSMLQSTFSDGHCFRPDFDISVIKENAAEPERSPENEKRDVEMQTFLLAYLTAKMESNTAKLKAEAEARILQMMEEEKALHNEVQRKKRQYLLAEKKRLENELLDLQIAALTPVAEAAKQFTEDYMCFATAVDTTRHELPVKNFFIDGDRREFLELNTGKYLVAPKNLYLPLIRLHLYSDFGVFLFFSSAFSELLELSSLVCRHTVHVQQAMEEEQLGTARTHELYCPKQ
uniref:HAUS augmin-like complex, subunit 8 n=1 Tax=Lates calcarifer TaxID=8187 RepID=A0A4W6DIL8_LATCA